MNPHQYCAQPFNARTTRRCPRFGCPVFRVSGPLQHYNNHAGKRCSEALTMTSRRTASLSDLFPGKRMCASFHYALEDLPAPAARCRHQWGVSGMRVRAVEQLRHLRRN